MSATSGRRGGRGSRPDEPRPATDVPDWRVRLHEVIFEAETPVGKAFDVSLMIVIILSVVAVMLESVASIRLRFGPELRAFE